MNAIPLRRDIYYPESDGQPMGETGVHVLDMMDLLSALWARYESVEDVYVAGNQFLYYAEGDPRAVVCPDIFVVKGIRAQPPRRIYKLWEEGLAPCLVIELTSDSTRNEDLNRKKLCYERLGVEEYLLFDLLGEYLAPPLQGFYLAAGRYRSIEPEADGSLLLRTLGLKLQADGWRLRLTDAATGEAVMGGLDIGKERARAAEALEAAEDRVRALEEELSRLRGSAPA